jgi:cathepsin B
MLTAILALAAATHYEKPPCASDEVQAQIQGISGSLCAPKCTGSTCPSDKPSCRASPQCALQDQSGNKYCALMCGMDSGCPTGAKCGKPGGLVGVCYYPTSEPAADAVTLTVASDLKMTSWESHGELVAEEELAKPALHTAEEIIAHNANPKATWVAGRNARFESATLKEAKVLMGTLQHLDMEAWLPHKELEAVELPTEFDWRTDPRAAECPSLKEIRDQASCGSCWAFGSVEAMTDRICIASKGADKSHLSAEDVTSCCTGMDNGCGGGIPSSVYQYYKNTGIVTGGNYGDKSMCYSYQIPPCAHHINSTHYQPCKEESTPACADKCVDNGADWTKDKRHGADGGYSVCKQGSGSCADQMMQEIYQNGPITGMFFVHQSLLSYKSGVYSAGWFWKDPMLGGHAIKIMGYGTEDGTPYWLVANSWNTEWGDQGYFKIKRGDDNCQIENSMINGGPVAGMPQAKTTEIVV